MSIPFVLRIPRAIVEHIYQQARDELPNECCGFLAGHPSDGIVTAIFPLINELASPTEFLSESRSLFAAHRAMRQQDVEVLAVYHSHPTSPPKPSRKDLDQNYSEQTMTLIVSLAGQTPNMRGWWLGPEIREGEWHIA